jgi:hypothetical protein
MKPLPKARNRDDVEPLVRTVGPWRYDNDGKVNFRNGGDADALFQEIEDTEFTDHHGATYERRNGVWSRVARSINGNVIGSWFLYGGAIGTAFRDLHAEVLAGNPIPAEIVEHPFVSLAEKYWPGDSNLKGVRPGDTRNHYLTREGGQYVKRGALYVFEPSGIWKYLGKDGGINKDFVLHRTVTGRSRSDVPNESAKPSGGLPRPRQREE